MPTGGFYFRFLPSHQACCDVGDCFHSVNVRFCDAMYRREVCKSVREEYAVMRRAMVELGDMSGPFN